MVSTEKLNGVMVYVECGANSLAVSTCVPSARREVVRMHTLAYPSELNVPTETPSMNAWYDESPPSPINQNVGVAVELAVLSEPTWRFVPHVPLSSCARFVVQADAPAATRNAHATAATSGKHDIAVRRIVESAVGRRRFGTPKNALAII